MYRIRFLKRILIHYRKTLGRFRKNLMLPYQRVQNLNMLFRAGKQYKGFGVELFLINVILESKIFYSLCHEPLSLEIADQLVPNENQQFLN